MNRSNPPRRRRILSGLLLALALPAASHAAQQASGLGQAWPNAPDLGASPRWHVYAFERDGVRFVQINDAAGRVLGAFATAGGQFLVLPMGTGATLTVDAGAAPATGETVYRDGNVQVTATPSADGTPRFRAASAPCTDPVECSTHVTSP
ncbi:hypothetical protein RKE25_15955 [Dyella sp. BiH032]|uniref:hypothetical protein n=1 Tax=Dyella sp. BiH032 TaxID=3075430 RepID=UPI00289336C7|nr:hypothetical protein [Dyella sp. BiH032]WNL44903.1 hypothetical protein RKE25_15955 [Dyella sp. BiH032]